MRRSLGRTGGTNDRKDVAFPLEVVVLHEFGHGAPKVALAERNELAQALGLDERTNRSAGGITAIDFFTVEVLTLSGIDLESVACTSPASPANRTARGPRPRDGDVGGFGTPCGRVVRRCRLVKAPPQPTPDRAAELAVVPRAHAPPPRERRLQAGVGNQAVLRSLRASTGAPLPEDLRRPLAASLHARIDPQPPDAFAGGG